MTLDIAPLPNELGFLTLGAYILTLMPTNLKIVFPRKFNWSLRNCY